MSLYPVRQDLIAPDWQHDPAIAPRLLIFHTAVSGAHGSGPTPHDGLEWHFYIDEDGTITQRRDTGEEADANYYANRFAISVETWDGGNPEGNPWTPAQVDSIVRLCHWANQFDGVPLVRPTRWDGDGVGYHRMFNEWNNPYHSCPGDTRAAQFDNTIWPRVVAGPTSEEPEVLSPTDPEVVNLKAVLKVIGEHVDQLTAKVSALDASLNARVGLVAAAADRDAIRDSLGLPHTATDAQVLVALRALKP